MAIPYEMLLHPELLTNEQLIYNIQERHLRVPHLEKMARDELLELFHQFCVPYGQRKYRDSGRGKILNKVRQLSPEPIAKLNMFNSNQSVKPQQCESFERLKPPAHLLAGHIKRIKLDCKLNNVNDVNTVKRKVSIDNAYLSSETPPHKKDRKIITWP